MNITEYSDLLHRSKKIEDKINKCLVELNCIKKRLSELDGTIEDEPKKEYSHFFDGHTPYFDVWGENQKQ